MFQVNASSVAAAAEVLAKSTLLLAGGSEAMAQVGEAFLYVRILIVGKMSKKNYRCLMTGTLFGHFRNYKFDRCKNVH